MTDDVDALLAARACEQLVFDSVACNDRRDWTALARLYTPDARLVRPSGEVIEGRDAIEASYRQASPDRRTRHVCTNVRITLDGTDAASVDTVVLLYTWTRPKAGAPGELPLVTAPALGEFADRCVRLADGWRIASRHAGLLARPAPPGPI